MRKILLYIHRLLAFFDDGRCISPTADFDKGETSGMTYPQSIQSIKEANSWIKYSKLGKFLPKIGRISAFLFIFVMLSWLYSTKQL